MAFRKELDRPSSVTEQLESRAEELLARLRRSRLIALDELLDLHVLGGEGDRRSGAAQLAENGGLGGAGTAGRADEGLEVGADREVRGLQILGRDLQHAGQLRDLVPRKWSAAVLDVRDE